MAPTRQDAGERATALPRGEAERLEDLAAEVEQEGASPARIVQGIPPIICTISLWQTESIQRGDQAQLRISGVEDALKERGIIQGKISARKGDFVVYTVLTKDGNIRELVQGDTHSVWSQHQSGQANREFFALVFKHAGEGRTVTCRVVQVEARSGKASRRGRHIPSSSDVVEL